MTKQYNAVVVWGVFDNLHLGHKKFLETVSTLSNKILVVFVNVNENHPDVLPQQTFEERKQNMENYLILLGVAYEIYGPLERFDDWDVLWSGEKNEEVDKLIAGVDIITGNAFLEQVINIRETRRNLGYSPKGIVFLPVFCDEKGFPYSSSQSTDLPKPTGNALNISLTDDKIEIYHKGANTQRTFSLPQFKEMVTAYLKYYEDGTTDFPLNLTLFPSNYNDYYLPIKNFNEKEYWSHRRELYSFVIENSLFPIQFNEYKIFSLIKIEWNKIWQDANLDVLVPT